ncbi:MAG: hypothetical protein Q4F28_10915, partial [Eubacteriales bacterium]|nr:hypothetical protein [Eubacteriales bacterium]
MLQILETGKALYVLAAICGLGILTRLITGRLYRRLLKESTNLGMTRHRRLKELRQRAENTYRMNQGLRDSGAWLEHQLNELRFAGMTLSGWSALSMQWTWLCLLTGAAGAFASYWYRLDTFYIVLYGGGAVMMAMLTMLFDLGAAGRKEQLLSSLQDYLENVMCPRMMRGVSADAGRNPAEERTADGQRRLLRGGRERRVAAGENQATAENGGGYLSDTAMGDKGLAQAEAAAAGRGRFGIGRRERGQDLVHRNEIDEKQMERGDAGGGEAMNCADGAEIGGAGEFGVSGDAGGGVSEHASPDGSARLPSGSVVDGGRSGTKGGRKLSGRAARRAAEAAAAAAAARVEVRSGAETKSRAEIRSG